jgi:hypothetical protein
MMRLWPVFILISLFASACMKAKAQREDLGPEFSADQISSALERATDKADLSGIAAGQNVQYSHTRRIENSETVLDLGSRRVDVLDRVDGTDLTTVTLRVSELMRNMAGAFESKITEDQLLLKRSPAAANSTALGSAHAFLMREIHGMADETTPRRTSFHHLKETDAIIDPPLAVKGRTSCNGLNPCSLHVHYVQFELVIWQDDKNYQKISFDFGFSLQTPFLPYGSEFEQLNGVMITDCRSTYVPIQSRSVYVRDCFDLEDFKK